MIAKKSEQQGLVGGAIWTTLSFVVVSIVYLLRISILTRYLDKSDFGLVAIILMVLGFTNIFADLGVSSALLSQNNISKKEYSSLYWGGAILSLILYIIILFLSPLFSYFYDEKALNYLIPIMGTDLLISTIGRQFGVFKQKELKFKELAFIKIVSEVISLLIAVLLAFNGYGVWSLILSLLSASLVNSLLNFFMGYRSHPLIFCFNYSDTKHLYRIGFYQTGAQILDYISSQIDILILGRILPMADMGVYSLVKNLVLRVYTSINQIVTKVAIPLFAKIQENKEVFKIKYLDILSVISILNTFIYYIIFVESEQVLALFFGKEYVQYSYILKLLCFWGVFSSVLNCTASIIVISTGRTDLGFKWTQFRLILNPIFIFVGTYFGGILGTAFSQAIYSFFTIFFYCSIVIKKVLPNFLNMEFFRILYSPILIACISFPLLYFINEVLKKTFNNNIYINLISAGIVVSVIFGLLFKRHLLNKINNIK